MVTIEDKINLFSKIMQDKVNEKINAKLEAVKKEEEEVFTKEEKSIKEYKEKTLKDIQRKCNSMYEQEVSKATFDKQEELTNLKEAMIRKTLDEIKNRLKEFINSDNYEEYIFSRLNKTLEDMKDGESAFIYFNNEDLLRFEAKLTKYALGKNIEISNSAVNILGGYIVEDKLKRFRVDCSLDSSIEECIEEIGIKITDIFM
ncbi:MAG: V-type ATP synthase subunit E family protein [Clostridiaceae bacterium]